MKQFIVAPAPHAHGSDSVRKNMLLVILALVPAYAVSVWQFGIGALITAAISILACVGTEWLISRFVLKEKRQTIGDLSAVLTGLLLAFNLPSSIDWWIVLIGAVVAIGVGKMTFGGLGQNPFNPALVGRVFLLISFPAQMTTWPVAKHFDTGYLDAETGATPLYYLKHMLDKNAPMAERLGSVKSITEIEWWDYLSGAMGGSLGEVCALALILGGIILICTKTITWHIPVSIIATVALFAACLGWAGMVPDGMETYQFVGYELLTGGLMLGAFFMATDYVTSPMTAWGKIIFGIGIGVLVMVIRTWGAYPEGMSFAILIMNACVPLLNKIRPTRFGEKKK
ncbi:MAG: RnfABCDGE type electron transport complex subunit D [Paludibacteraceae bacterium]|nr:RnfABCDGE type electron transport complex subunit D [Paludibacteraceae bacterium]